MKKYVGLVLMAFVCTVPAFAQRAADGGHAGGGGHAGNGRLTAVVVACLAVGTSRPMVPAPRVVSQKSIRTETTRHSATVTDIPTRRTCTGTASGLGIA